MAQVKAVPEHLHSITANLVCRDAAKAIEFYKNVFGATVLSNTLGPKGEVMHAELKIGDSVIFLNEAMVRTLLSAPGPNAVNPTYLHLYVPDADDVFKKAIAGGARQDVAIQDMFWGDRYGMITDPFGQQWGIATRKEEVSPEELRKRTEAMFAQRSAGSGS
jgi:PhnB protein